MRKNPVKERLQQGRAVVGAFCNLPSPGTVELLGYLGFDYIVIDAEHGPMDVESAEHMVRAADVTGVTSVARVAMNHPQNLLRYLDAGALGVQIPMVNTVDDAKSVVEATKYPPRGRRGLASVRANGYGAGMPMDEYVTMANRETLVIVQIETVQAMERVRDIAGVDQVDVVFIGPTDLSTSMGYPGQPGHPEVLAAIESLGREIQSMGKVAGTMARDPESYRRWRERGFQYLATTVGGLVSRAGTAFLESCREHETALSR